MMDWLELNAELQAEGWSLQLNNRANQWRAFYGNMAYIPRCGQGGSPQEAVEMAYNLIKGGSG